MESMIRDIRLAESGQKKIDWVKGHMPLLNYLFIKRRSANCTMSGSQRCINKPVMGRNGWESCFPRLERRLFPDGLLTILMDFPNDLDRSWVNRSSLRFNGVVYGYLLRSQGRPAPGRAATPGARLTCWFIFLCVFGVSFYNGEHSVNQLCSKHIQDTHNVLTFFEFAFVVILIFPGFHARCHVHCAHVQ